ncbi:hypothetical protein [Legionella clemsonensis]|uniref:Uncharacterized protein n=1 Tax=Legionella clemsonensis TaxID=1867846 RepID=A0A222NZ40_9GAMM|nr:hypothetical protein [Legionella clemsonensis]ASQ44815.1 hypothetical protein clem_01245 [Legionella clemsonensis]
MKGRFFKAAKQQLSFEDYLQETLILARRIVEISPGRQRFTGAQFELALVSFGDLKALKKEMDPTINVQFPPLKCDWLAGFDWLDLAVSYCDKDAIAYFQEKLDNNTFYSVYNQYKTQVRPDCALRHHESTVQDSKYNG